MIKKTVQTVTKFATTQSIKVSELTISTSMGAGNFMTDVADAVLFISRMVK